MRPTAASAGLGPGRRPGALRPTATTGWVEDFDVAVGLGVVRGDDGVRLGFHCTQIAGGGRDIAVGTPVRFAVVAGRGGRWEAAEVTPTPGGPAPEDPGPEDQRR